MLTTKRTKLFTGIITMAVFLMAVFVTCTATGCSGGGVDPSEYLKVSFSETDEQYEGMICGSVEFDNDAIIEALTGDKSLDEVHFNEYDVNEILSYASISLVDESADSGEEKNNSFSEVNSTDTLKVEVSWPEDNQKFEKISTLEKEAGISFSKNNKTVEVSVAEQIEAQNQTIKTPVLVDLCKYIQDNKLYYTAYQNISRGDYECEITNFGVEQGGYLISNSEYSTDSVVRVYKKSDADSEGVAPYKQS